MNNNLLKLEIMINSLVPIKNDALDNSLAAPSSDYNGNYELFGKRTILLVRRYFKITRQRFITDDTKMLVGHSIGLYRDVWIAAIA